MARNKGSHTQAIRLIRILDQLQGHRVGVRLVELEEAHGHCPPSSPAPSQLRRGDFLIDCVDPDCYLLASCSDVVP